MDGQNKLTQLAKPFNYETKAGKGKAPYTVGSAQVGQLQILSVSEGEFFSLALVVGHAYWII